MVDGFETAGGGEVGVGGLAGGEGVCCVFSGVAGSGAGGGSGVSSCGGKPSTAPGFLVLDTVEVGLVVVVLVGAGCSSD